MIRQNPKPLIGYKITALHTSINKLCGFMHSTVMPNTELYPTGRLHVRLLEIPAVRPQEICELQNPPGRNCTLYPTGSGTNIENASRAPGISGAPHTPKSNPIVTGRLTGGNLSLDGTLGSPGYRTKDAILFLEDVGDRPYRLDRNLTALALAGKFRDCAGIILGTFTDCEEPPTLTRQTAVSSRTSLTFCTDHQ